MSPFQEPTRVNQRRPAEFAQHVGLGPAARNDAFEVLFRQHLPRAGHTPGGIQIHHEGKLAARLAGVLQPRALLQA